MVTSKTRCTPKAETTPTWRPCSSLGSPPALSKLPRWDTSQKGLHPSRPAPVDGESCPRALCRRACTRRPSTACLLADAPAAEALPQASHKPPESGPQKTPAGDPYEPGRRPERSIRLRRPSMNARVLAVWDPPASTGELHRPRPGTRLQHSIHTEQSHSRLALGPFHRG